MTRRCRLDSRDRSVYREIPVTTVPRTLVDMAADLDDHDLARAVLGRRPNAPGARNLWRIMSGDVHVTLSVVERVFIERLRAERPPLPVREQDHQRRREARARGDRFRRYSYRDVLEDPRDMLAELRELLRTAGG